jgi:hypothetical protein
VLSFVLALHSVGSSKSPGNSRVSEARKYSARSGRLISWVAISIIASYVCCSAQQNGFNAAALQDQRSLNTRSLVAIQIGLALSNVIGVGGGNLVHVTTAVMINVLSYAYRRFQGILIPYTVKATVRIDLMFMDGIDDFAGEKLRLSPPSHLARRRNSPSCSVDVFRISFLAFSKDIARRRGVGGTERSEVLCSGTAARVMV